MKPKALIPFHGTNATIKREKDREVNEMRSGKKTPLYYWKTDRIF
jgi:hypothetical protein